MTLSTPTFEQSRFVSYTGIKWSGVLKGIAKSQEPLQPVFEAFTNSIESIKLRQEKGDVFEPFIYITLNFNPGIEGEGVELVSIEVEDNGVGFDAENYQRLITFKDDTKGFNNRGSGRIQFVHFFQYAQYYSTYTTLDELEKKTIILSKESPFIGANSLVYLDSSQVVDPSEQVSTKLILDTPIVARDRNYYSGLSLEDVKNALISHYILSLCSIRDALPDIKLFYSVAGSVVDRNSIVVDDIPVPTSDEFSVDIPKCKISDDMKRIEPVPDSAVNIHITPFKIPSEKLERSEIKITSKGEISDSAKIKVTCMDPDAEIDGNRYLFLLSSDYFDNLEGDERGNIDILDKTEFKKMAKSSGAIDEQIVINDIQDAVNEKALNIYSEIASRKEAFKLTVDKLKRDYLLSDEALEDVSMCDSVEEVLKKAYNYDAKVVAHQQAVYEKSIKDLSSIDPSSKDYKDSLSQIVDELVESIPIQNRVTLSKYVARRNMVINLLGMILGRMTAVQTSSLRNEDEKLLHNLIFKQHSNNPLESDLWLINEEYMYFKGVSESLLSKIKVDGKDLFKSTFSEEEERYLTSLGENRLKMRCDILLFPAEGKCVIIEFKNPDVNVSDHLDQITKYAYFIRNFANDEFKIQSFYGYLIGEGIEPRDVRSADGDFETAPNNEYMFRPRKRIPDDSGANVDGYLYTEVMKFSSLKKRAEIRNKAFSDRLLNVENQSKD